MLDISGNNSTVIFLDVTKLGNRCLVGINGRNPHMTDDHPILSAAVHILPNPCHEELLFVDVEAALRSRHWPNPKELVVDESIFWSMDDVHETLPRKERLQSIE